MHTISPVVLSIITIVVVLLGVAGAAVAFRQVSTVQPAGNAVTVAARQQAVCGRRSTSRCSMRPGLWLSRALVYFDNRGVDGAVERPRCHRRRRLVAAQAHADRVRAQLRAVDARRHRRRRGRPARGEVPVDASYALVDPHPDPAGRLDRRVPAQARAGAAGQVRSASSSRSCIVVYVAGADRPLRHRAGGGALPVRGQLDLDQDLRRALRLRRRRHRARARADGRRARAGGHARVVEHLRQPLRRRGGRRPDAAPQREELLRPAAAARVLHDRRVRRDRRVPVLRLLRGDARADVLHHRQLRRPAPAVRRDEVLPVLARRRPADARVA